MANSKPDVYQIVTDRIVNLLEEGVAPWRKPWNTAGVDNGPANLVSKKHYQGINTFILACQPYESPYWLTFKQALDKGRNVRKGERGTPVIFWKILEKDAPQDNSGLPAIPTLPDGVDASGKRRFGFLRYYTVFNIEQCDGVEAPPLESIQWPEHERIERAEAIQLAMPNRPVVEYGGAKAFYRPSTDSVKVPELKRYEKPEEFYSTLFHELAHATGHASRLNREGIVGYHFFGDPVYSREELVAEMTAAFLCAHCGIENQTIENSAAYLQGWIRQLRGDKKLAITAAANAQKAANYILNIQPE